MLDYVIVKKRDRQDVLLTQAMRGAECWTDHQLVRSSLSVNIRPPTRKRPAKKKMNCASLRSDIVKKSLRTAIAHCLADAPHVEEFEDCVECSWSHLAHTVTDAAKEILGFVKRKNEDWFDSNIPGIRELLKIKNEVHRAYLGNPSSAYLKKL